MSGTDNKDKDKAGQDASFAERETALNDRETAIAAREQAVNDKAEKDRHDANVSFAEGLMGAAKIKPAGKDLLIGVLDALGGTDTVSFGEAGDLTPRDALVKLLEGAQPLVSLGEKAADDGTAIGELDPAAIAREAASFAESEAAAGRPISMARAVNHVKTQAKKGA